MSKIINIKDKPRKRRPKPYQRGKIVLGILVIILVLAGFFWGVKSLAQRVLVDIVQVQESTLEEVMNTQFLVLRREIAVAVSSAGQIEFLHSEGERVAKDTVIAYLSKEQGTSLESTVKTALTAPQAGVLSLTADGLEEVCSPDAWSRLDISKLNNEKGLGIKREGEAKNTQRVEAGQYLFKVTDNLAPSFLYFEMDNNLPGLLQKGKRVQIRLALPDNPLTDGIVEELSADGTKKRVLARVVTFPGLEKVRKVSGEIITGKYVGLVLPEKVLSDRDGVTGVYIMEKGKALWRPVAVKANSKGFAVVEGLDSGDWVITAPALVKEGQRVFGLKNKLM